LRSLGEVADRALKGFDGGVSAGHWDDAYAARGAEAVSWFEAEPRTSLDLIEALDVPREAAVVDVGAGASLLADRLLERGFTDLTLLDLSVAALDTVAPRLPAGAPVTRVHADLLTWRPERQYELWHDRATLHFLVNEDERAAYVRALRGALAQGGAVIVATFAPDAPDHCSGLPVRRYEAADLTALLGESFELVDTLREEHVTPRGAVQPLTWIAGRLAAGGAR
jgi:trans-aconitate methyltransferase